MICPAYILSPPEIETISNFIRFGVIMSRFFGDEKKSHASRCVIGRTCVRLME
jgi:hypothetical protein